MRNILIFGTLLLCLLVRFPAGAAPVLAPSGQNAFLVYDAQVLIPPNEDGSVPNEQQIHDAIHLQTKYHMGTFETVEYTYGLTGGYALNGDKGLLALNSIRAVKIKSLETTKAGSLISYKIAVETLVHARLFQDRRRFTTQVFLPLDPFRYFDRKCVEKKYDWPEFYFAFWKILTPQCRHHIGKEVQALPAEVFQRQGPTAVVSPRYDRLMAQAAKNGALRIALLLSFDESRSKRDLGRLSFVELGKRFLQMGFEVRKDNSKAEEPSLELVKAATENYPAVEIYLSLSDADDISSKIFPRRMQWALEKADFVGYMGHSGLGENLDLERIQTATDFFRKIESRTERQINFGQHYQVYYFGACESLFWYSSSYELAKRGKRNVDIVSYGLSSLFSTQNAEILNLLRPFISGTRPNWFEILQGMERPLRGQTYLVNVGAIQ